MHGGAFVAGGLDGPEPHTVGLALAAAGVRVVSVDYPLAPVLPWLRRKPAAGRRLRYPAQVHDVVAVVEHVRAAHRGPVLLGGASAGACLAAGAVFSGAPVDGVLCAYGFFHARLPRRPERLFRPAPGRRRFVHTRRPIALMNLNYTGSRTLLREPSAFPGGHPVRSFPPTLLLDAERDAMRASSGPFARDLAAAGVPVEHHVLPGALHGFVGRPHERAFSAAVDRAARWIGSFDGGDRR